MATPGIRDAIRTMQRGPGMDEGWIATNATAADDTPAQEVKAAPGTGKRLVVTDVMVTNTGSGTGVWELRETGLTGTIVARGALAAGNTNATTQIYNFAKPIILSENVALIVMHVASGAVIATVNGFTIDSADIK